MLSMQPDLDVVTWLTEELAAPLASAVAVVVPENGHDARLAVVPDDALDPLDPHPAATTVAASNGTSHRAARLTRMGIEAPLQACIAPTTHPGGTARIAHTG